MAGVAEFHDSSEPLVDRRADRSDAAACRTSRRIQMNREAGNVSERLPMRKQFQAFLITIGSPPYSNSTPAMVRRMWSLRPSNTCAEHDCEGCSPPHQAPITAEASDGPNGPRVFP